MNRLKINIIGAGSIGHLWTLKLQENNQDVRLYHKGQYDEKTIELVTPSTTFRRQVAYHNLAKWRQADVTIVSVKAPSLNKLCLTLKDLMNNREIIILMMNGLGLIENVKMHLPNIEVIQASTTHGAKLDELRQHIALHHTGKGKTLLGKVEQTNPQASNRMKEIIEVMNFSLPTTRWNLLHRETLTRKLLINAIINPLTAVQQVPNGSIVTDRDIFHQAQVLAQELSPFIEKYLQGETWRSIFDEVKSVASQTSSNVSSMRQDINHRRKTEIQFITGYILNKANELGFEMPNHVKIFKQIKSLEEDYSNSVTN